MALSDILGELTPVKPGDDVSEVASSKRMNAIQQAIMALCKGENISAGPNVRKHSGDGWVILQVDPTGRRSAGGASDFPFKVTATTKDGYTALRISPGLIMNVVPYIQGELMTKQVYDGQGKLVDNTLTPPNSAQFNVWLIVRIRGYGYHPRIDVAEPGETGFTPILPPAQSCYLTCVDPALVDQVDWRVKPDDATDITGPGGFPIKIAEVTATVGGTTGPVITRIVQFLDTNYRSLAMMGMDVIPLG